jgi:hypothetical protein
MNGLLAKVKQNNEDFEWYPTTNEIIEALYKDILSLDESTSSILDIGAGDGNVFKVLTQLSKDHKEKVADIPRENRNGNYQYYNYVETFNPTFYAIEKSKTLIQAMDKDVFVVGSDFNEQSLIDKKVDCIYCNPPYSEYEEWTNKILREANSKIVYLLIPKRWTENEIIQHTIAEREIKYAVIGEYSFEHSDGDIFVALRLYQNGNIHFKFSQKFIKKLNIEAARLNGWIKSPKEASEEFDVTFEEAAQMFKNNLQLTASNVILIEEAV